MTRRDLDNLREMHRQRRSILDRIERLQTQVERTSPNLDGMPHGGQQKDLMAEYAANLDDALRVMAELEQRLSIMIEGVEQEIRTAQLPSRQTAIIWMRYAEGKTIGQIGHELHYSRPWVYQQYKKAMETLFPKV